MSTRQTKIGEIMSDFGKNVIKKAAPRTRLPCDYFTFILKVLLKIPV